MYIFFHTWFIDWNKWNDLFKILGWQRSCHPALASHWPDRSLWRSPRGAAHYWLWPQGQLRWKVTGRDKSAWTTCRYVYITFKTPSITFFCLLLWRGTFISHQNRTTCRYVDYTQDAVCITCDCQKRVLPTSERKMTSEVVSSINLNEKKLSVRFEKKLS